MNSQAVRDTEIVITYSNGERVEEVTYPFTVGDVAEQYFRLGAKTFSYKKKGEEWVTFDRESF